MSPSSPTLPALDGVLNSLIQDRVCFFPLRHHSPACAWHIQQWIQVHRPSLILIEGPSDATALIPFILNNGTHPPFALYTTYIDHDQHLDIPGRRKDHTPPRFAGYFPFCAYSPELVALQMGAQVGATLRFIDLTYPEQVLHSFSRSDTTPRLRALQDEHHLKRSQYLRGLAQKTGCRDQDDLWDHLFEVSAQQIGTETFIQSVATYCYFARIDASLETLEIDGTLAREARMASQIAAALAETPGQILVVTGGFHTVALPHQLTDPASVSKDLDLKLNPESAQTVLMRYSFAQLDALNGYAAGMPAPEYYHQLWQKLQQGDPAPALNTACDLIITVGRLTRQSTNRLTALSVADEIAALDQTRRLAQFRHHPGPSREDLLDGIRSCLIKGSMDTEGAWLLASIQQIFRGDRVGDLPPDVGVPPLVEDFRQQARALKLKIETSHPQSLTLDIYRKRIHRQISRFLHRLRFLEIPFGHLGAGPDFVQGTGLDRIREQWETRWSPQTESNLIERSLYGTTLEEAALARVQDLVQEFEAEGKGRSAVESVRLLIAACRMGLHRYTNEILAVIDDQVATDPSFISLVDAIGQLTLLWHSREPLQAHGLDQLPALAQTAYRRACYLVPHLAHHGLEESNSILNSFSSIWEVLNHTQTPILDSDLFISALLDLLSEPAKNPIVLGGGVGILHMMGTLATPDLITLTAGYLDSAPSDPAVGVGFLRGLLRTCRDLAWSLPELLRAINQRLEQWSPEDFLHVLPELRLAFADLVPRETDRVAAIVAQLQGVTDLGNLVYTQSSVADLTLGLKVDQLMRESLQRDHLSWAQELE